MLMRRAIKVKSAGHRASVRKTATTASAAARRNFPAWIDANESSVVFNAARTAQPRVRDGLVLRRVSSAKQTERSVPHGRSPR